MQPIFGHLSLQVGMHVWMHALLDVVNEMPLMGCLLCRCTAKFAAQFNQRDL